MNINTLFYFGIILEYIPENDNKLKQRKLVYSSDKNISYTFCGFLRSVERESRYNCVKKNQLDAQIILSIFRQPLLVSGVSRLIIMR
jgi:hypothetical protein